MNLGFLNQHISSLAEDLAAVDASYVMLAIILVSAAIVLDSVTAFIRSRRRESGMTEKSSVLSIDDSQSLPLRHYVSHKQGLAGRPDALIVENGFTIPVERKPLARKIRDRYVAQLLVYMRLVEEFEGKRPPYGYLILGPSCRRFKIENSPERQAWLQKMLDEMREVIQGSPAKASPHPKKCAKCDVRNHCKFAIGQSDSKTDSKTDSKKENIPGKNSLKIHQAAKTNQASECQ